MRASDISFSPSEHRSIVEQLGSRRPFVGTFGAGEESGGREIPLSPVEAHAVFRNPGPHQIQWPSESVFCFTDDVSFRGRRAINQRLVNNIGDAPVPGIPGIHRMRWV